ncbi:MAG: GlsB/YeaQ/YmgE family stress response membrane protein [Oscillibacter sp.]|jgi:uncharacterized membrane protein YeaQ/YmgE (transglycosylase-associated protein family)|nr:GlsB/YeaQ/YmgE family stress response membrane protein [Oscillibacter sp.]
MHFLIWLISGALIGWIASLIMKSKSSILRNIIVGIVGSSLGGWLAGLIGLHGTGVGSILISVAGACLLVWLARKLFK